MNQETETSSMKPTNTELIFSKESYEKIMFWVDKCDFEVSGLGNIEIIDGVPHVVDVCLIEQEGTGTSTDLNPQATSKAMFELHKSNKEKGGTADMRFWWHSHVNMEAFWSGTDLDTIHQLGQHGWFFATVFNKRRETQSAVFMGKPFHLFVDKLVSKLQHEKVDDPRHPAWAAEYDAKVKRKSYTGHHGGLYDMDDYGYGGYGQKNWNQPSLVNHGKPDWDDHRRPRVEAKPEKSWTSQWDDEEIAKDIQNLRQQGWSEMDIEQYMELPKAKWPNMAGSV